MKVYTYSDPFKLKETKFWEWMTQYPNLCVSQTLVQGLTDPGSYGRENFQFIYTIDEFISEFYKEWYSDAENEIKQYTSLSEEIKNVKNTKIRSAMKFNQREMMEALRFLIELNLQPEDFDINQLNEQQILLMDIYTNIRNKDYWSNLKILKNKKEGSIRHTLFSMLEMEMKRTRDLNKQQIIAKKIQHFQDKKNIKIDKFIFHGVHQFTPIILTLIHHLEHLNNINIECIFIINYMHQYNKIYDTWDRVYEWTEQPFEYDQIRYVTPNRIGEAIGDLLEGRMNKHDLSFLEYKKYDNLTVLGDVVSKIFKEGLLDNKFKYGVGALAKMKHQFYAPNNQGINDLLKSYFPEQFTERHFLSYPIGQFILSLYNMWDDKKKKIIIKENELKECLTTNFFREENQPSPIEIYDQIALYFKDIYSKEKGSIEDFNDRLNLLMKNIQKINSDNTTDDFKIFSFYNVTYKELEYFQRVTDTIFEIIHQLFSINSNGKVSYYEHYRKLIDIISAQSHQSRVFSEKEKKLVEEIKDQFENIHNLKIETSIEDLKQTLHLYLKPPKDESEYAKGKWIVRNFEQIDGGVLLSRNERGVNTHYHFALLSDDMMKVSVRDRLPWPLTEDLFRACQKDVKELKIVLTCYQEYSNFLRYSLFYGTYYLQNPIIFSFVENLGNEPDIPYFLLSMLGIDPTASEQDEITYHSEKVKDKEENIILYDTNRIPHTKFNATSLLDIQTFSLCPHRYLLDRILDRESTFRTEFLCWWAYVIFLYKYSWQQLQSKPSDQIKEVINNTDKKLQRYFPFWKEVNFIDARSKVYNYLKNDQVNANGRIKKLDEYYTKIRMNFIQGKLTAINEKEKKTLMSHFYKELKFSEEKRDEWSKEIDEFIFDANMIKEEKTEYDNICNYCKQREVCMHSFMEERRD